MSFTLISLNYGHRFHAEKNISSSILCNGSHINDGGCYLEIPVNSYDTFLGRRISSGPDGATRVKSPTPLQHLPQGVLFVMYFKKEFPTNKRCLYEMPEKTKLKTICNKCLMPVSLRIAHY